MTQDRYIVGVDTGGTFTDGFLVDENGRVSIAKVPTISDDPSQGVIECLAVLVHYDAHLRIKFKRL